jgi:hypothetical protein
VASGWDDTGGGASSWNDNTNFIDNTGDNFGDAGGVHLNNGFGDHAGGEGGPSDTACRRCGEGTSSPCVLGEYDWLTFHQRVTSPTSVARFVLTSFTAAPEF